MIDPNLINVLTQGGFAALFIWLLITTKTESAQRETRLTNLLERYAENLPKMAETLRQIESRLERIEEKDK